MKRAGVLWPRESCGRRGARQTPPRQERARPHRRRRAGARHGAPLGAGRGSGTRLRRHTRTACRNPRWLSFPLSQGKRCLYEPAGFVGRPAEKAPVHAAVQRHPSLCGPVVCLAAAQGESVAHVRTRPEQHVDQAPRPDSPPGASAPRSAARRACPPSAPGALHSNTLPAPPPDPAAPARRPLPAAARVARAGQKSALNYRATRRPSRWRAMLESISGLLRLIFQSCLRWWRSSAAVRGKASLSMPLAWPHQLLRGVRGQRTNACVCFPPERVWRSAPA